MTCLPISTPPLRTQLAYGFPTPTKILHCLTLFGFPDAPLQLAFSPDGLHLAVGERGPKPAVIIWELSSGRVMAELRAHRRGVGTLCWSPDGSQLVTVGFRSDHQVNLWDWREGRLVGHGRVGQRVFAAEFLPDGVTFVTVGEKHVKWWEVPLASAALVAPTKPELRGRPAAIDESLRDATFMDVACGGPGGAVYAVTSTGKLCALMPHRPRSLLLWASRRARPIH